MTGVMHKVGEMYFLYLMCQDGLQFQWSLVLCRTSLLV